MSAPPRIIARVGDLEFAERYGDPAVDVRSRSNTVEKQVLGDEVVVQHMGSRADRITIDGIIHEDDIGDLDSLSEDGEVEIRTHRWSGKGIVNEVSSTYTHSYDIAPPSDVDSEWLYEVTIDAIEVEKTSMDIVTIGGAGGTGGGGINSPEPAQL